MGVAIEDCEKQRDRERERERGIVKRRAGVEGEKERKKGRERE